MRTPENPLRPARPGEPLRPTSLPPELAVFLRDQDLVALLHGSDQGSLYIVKAPRRDIEGLRGAIPIRLVHELHDQPTAPVIRSVLTFYDQLSSPLKLESFVNVDDEQQRADFAALAGQETIPLLFYDERLRHLLAKRMTNHTAGEIPTILELADWYLAAVPANKFDFEAAKAAVMEATPL